MKAIHYFAAAALLLAGCAKEQSVTYNSQPALRQTLSTSITATGTIEPVTQVTVGTQVSGIIDKIYVDYNSVVKKGQVIAELDKTNLRSALQSAQSNLQNAQSSLAYQQTNYNRMKTLYDKGLISADEYDQAKLSYHQAQQQVQVQQQSVQQARTNLGYATITAPIDGVVLKKAVEEGQTVAAAMTTPELFTIAQDLTDMRVIADIDEADIGGVREGQHVTFSVDAFPDDTFEGHVTQVRQEATTESNVVTYEVVISAPNPDLKLKPGLTANVNIVTMEVQNALVVPASALQFRPDSTLLTPEQSIQDVQAEKKVWTLDGTVLRAVAVQTGMTDGTLVEVLSGLPEGTKVITDCEVGGLDNAGAEANQNPFMPKMKRRDDKKNTPKK
ncbi:MAG: efflux RND transporter periplasmic adaptor subunit [Bacteroidaceae bacterium]|nr:efflux RND transporter periplasmic adaptor subunit [Candidatus Equimonas faecalis]MCQ2205795.1 efflux RND transporter periplasmic adaptor subunit [Bacteroidaceae bacterium]